MDTSNPVIDSDRVKLIDARNDNLDLKRQDFKILNDLVKNGKRVGPLYFQECPEVEVSEETLDSLIESGMVQSKNKDLLSLITLDKKELPVLPSSSHVQGTNQEGHKVSVKRFFPQRKRVRPMLHALLKYNPGASREIAKVTYSGGTVTGFAKRLTTWSERKVVEEQKVLALSGFTVGEMLDLHLPIDPTKLPDYRRPINQLINEIEITMNSGAGPPYFKQKFRCLDEILRDVAVIIDRVSDGTIQKHFSQNYEFVMSECKNKLDRYEMEKIHDKTRPYWNFSASVSFLISVLCQGITHALYKFDQKGSNAYGFSYAHGGGSRLWKWMNDCKENERKFCAYGDDCLLVYRKDGQLYEINPDFEQMDASLEYDTVKRVTDWVYDKYRKQYGESRFWNYVTDMWAYLATKSPFFVEGPTAYTSKTGLRTGIVGTTLFDTAKAVCAYGDYCHQRINPLDKEASTKFLRTHGLVVKEGTWKPAKVFDELEEGAICKTQKFLGCTLKVVKGNTYPEPVPYVEEDDLLKLMGNIRQDQDILAKDKTMTARRLFDTARGYMITAAYHHPRMWNSLATLIDETPNEIVTMRVQTGRGKGPKPDNHMIVGEDFEWPASDGFPTVEFCTNVYLSLDNRFEQSVQGDTWQHIFPDLVPALKEYRKKKEVVELIQFKPETVDWNKENFQDQIFNEYVDKVVPPVDKIPDQEIYSKVNFKWPENVVVWKARDPVSLETKEEKILKVVNEMERVHHRFLDAYFSYGTYFITTVMLKNKWFWDTKGYWTLKESEQASHITNMWSYEAQAAMGVKKNADSPPSTQIVEAKDIPAMGVFGIPNLMPFVEEITSIPKIADEVSLCCAIFNQIGNAITEESLVLTQNPSRVKLTLMIKASRFELGYAIDTTKKIAKKKLCELIVNNIVAGYYGKIQTTKSEKEPQQSVPISSTSGAGRPCGDDRKGEVDLGREA